VPIAIRGLASLFLGRGSPAHLFLWDFTCCAGLPLPIRLQVYQSEVVYHGFRSDHRQDPAEMKKTIPSLDPSWLFSWAMRVLSHQRCSTKFLRRDRCTSGQQRSSHDIFAPDHQDFVIQSKLLTVIHVICGDITTCPNLWSNSQKN
jgi:hypothetical protein